MGIVFFCQSCGARFEVGPQMGGRKGRCTKCGQTMQVPHAEQLASMSAIPALAGGDRPSAAQTVTSARMGGAPARRADGEQTLSSWLKAAATNVGLEALTLDRVPVGLAARKAAASAYDFNDNSKPYLLAGPGPAASGGSGSHAAGVVVRTWKREIGMIQRIFRWLNESAYLVSVPFLLIMLFGVVTKSRGTAMFGATFVVTLNLGRIVAGLANLAFVPLRDGINIRKMKKPFWRVVDPVLTIALILLGFTFIPWLASGHKTGGTITQQLEQSARGLGQEMKNELGETLDKAGDLKPSELGDRAREFLDGPTPPGQAPQGPAGPGAEVRVRDLVDGVGDRARQVINGSGGTP